MYSDRRFNWFGVKYVYSVISNPDAMAKIMHYPIEATNVTIINRVSYRVFCWGGGGGGLFWKQQKRHMKHTFIRRSVGMSPRKSFTNNCPEIESGRFWQLADGSQVPITCLENH